MSEDIARIKIDFNQSFEDPAIPLSDYTNNRGKSLPYSGPKIKQKPKKKNFESNLESLNNYNLRPRREFKKQRNLTHQIKQWIMKFLKIQYEFIFEISRPR